MWKRFKSAIGFRPEGHEGIETPAGVHAVFYLEFGDLEIGVLELCDRVWTFRYSDTFKEQSAVSTLVDFPDRDQEYRARELWPFFVARIPSLAQPQVLATVKDEGLDMRSDVDLLRRFGRQSISNPFILKSA